MKASSLRVIGDALRADAGDNDGAGRRRSLADWTCVLRQANDHLVTPAMFSSLTAADGLDDLPEEVRDYLALLHHHNGLRNAALREQSDELLAALNHANIVPLFLKGALTLYLNHYNDRAARMIGDLDLLVPHAQLKSAIGVIEGLGYRIGTQYTPVLHAYAEFLRDGSAGAVDLHVELVDANYLLQADDVWSRATRRCDNGLDYMAPSPTDMILHNLWHAQIHHIGGYYRGIVDLRQLYDFTMIARRFGPDINWEMIEARAARYQLSAPLHSYLIAAHEMFALPWPLKEPPLGTAWAHWRRCRLQLRYPQIDEWTLPWANLRAAFAAHRMINLYGGSRAVAISRFHHAMTFLAKQERQDFLGRLFRVS